MARVWLGPNKSLQLPALICPALADEAAVVTFMVTDIPSGGQYGMALHCSLVGEPEITFAGMNWALSLNAGGPSERSRDTDGAPQ